MIGLSLVLAAVTAVNPLSGEKWWGGTTLYGHQQPYVTTEGYDLANSSHCNPCTPFLVSSKGRYVWSERPFAFAFTNGVAYVTSDAPVEIVEAGKTLKEAYLAASAKHFPPSGRIPEEIFFTKPQFNTWVESCAVGNGQAFVEDYVDGIASNRFSCGVFMIDDGWAPKDSYGDCRFEEKLFPEPKRLFAKTRAAGFKTILWTTPYIYKGGRDYAWLEKAGLLLKNDVSGKTHDAVYYWGLPAAGILDLFDRKNWDVIEKRYTAFMAEYGFDGYKFDFTDADCVLRKPDASVPGSPLPKGKVPADYTEVWGPFAERFPYHELRASWRAGGRPLVFRLQDKAHSWDALRELVPDMLAAGVQGCAFTCPDMIGGGCGGETFAQPGAVDRKLFVRSCEVQALMPMMQFSAAPWRLLDKEGVDICRAMSELHGSVAPEILELARHSAKTGEPIVRLMEYEFPGQGFDACLQQFMLGSRRLVAPVVNEDDSVMVKLPAGTWKDDLGENHVGPKALELKNVPLDRLPRFERM